MPTFTCIATLTAPDAESADEIVNECLGSVQDAKDSGELPDEADIDFAAPVQGACPVIGALQGCARLLLASHQSHTPEFAAACKALADAGFTHQRGLSLSASGYPTRGVLAEGSQKVVDNFVRALADMSFGDDDSPVSGGDLVDVVNTHFPGLHRIASRDFPPPRFLELQQRIKIGTRVLSIEGETSDTDTEDDVHTGPNAFGTVTNIFPDQECAYGVSFEPSGVSVFLSLSELADETRYDVHNVDEDDEPFYVTRDDAVNMIVALLGDGGSTELAGRVFDYMREQGIVTHNGQGFVIERDANIFQYAANLAATIIPDEIAAKLPERAYLPNRHHCTGPHGEPPVIGVQRGEVGYWPLYTNLTADELNAPLNITPDQLAAMEHGSMFGWDTPGADPDYHRKLRERREAEGNPN